MTIAAILRDKGGDVVQVEAGATVAAVVALLAERRIGAVPVTEHGAVIGIVSERDVIQALARAGAAALALPAGELMTRPAITVPPDATLLAGLALMTRRRVRHLPVVDGGRMVGFVSIGDLVKARIDGIEAEAAALRSYISG